MNSSLLSFSRGRANSIGPINVLHAKISVFTSVAWIWSLVQLINPQAIKVKKVEPAIPCQEGLADPSK